MLVSGGAKAVGSYLTNEQFVPFPPQRLSLFVKDLIRNQPRLYVAQIWAMSIVKFDLVSGALKYFTKICLACFGAGAGSKKQS